MSPEERIARLEHNESLWVFLHLIELVGILALALIVTSKP